MKLSHKSAAVSLAILAATIVTASADPARPTARPEQIGAPGGQVAALPTGGDLIAGLLLPNVKVVGPMLSAGTGLGPRSSSTNAAEAPHFRVWSGYDADVALHPYTSHIGPCPEGTTGSGCDRSMGTVIQPSRYERPPFTD